MKVYKDMSFGSRIVISSTTTTKLSTTPDEIKMRVSSLILGAALAGQGLSESIFHCFFPTKASY